MKFKDIEKKFLLLDSNILINYSKFQPYYEGLFEEFEKHDVKLAVDPLVKFEILRVAESAEERADLEEKFFDILLTADLSLPKAKEEIHELAGSISNLYQQQVKQSSGISVVDIFLAARMLKYQAGQESKLFLATENHKDFPLELFQRMGVYTIDREYQIHNVGFYRIKPSIDKNSLL